MARYIYEGILGVCDAVDAGASDEEQAAGRVWRLENLQKGADGNGISGRFFSGRNKVWF